MSTALFQPSFEVGSSDAMNPFGFRLAANEFLARVMDLADRNGWSWFTLDKVAEGLKTFPRRFVQKELHRLKKGRFLGCNLWGTIYMLDGKPPVLRFPSEHRPM